jgi:hypothetical protein
MWFVWIFLLGAVGSISWNLSHRKSDPSLNRGEGDVSQRNTEGKSGSPQLIQICEKAETFCTMQYLPADCSIEIDQKMQSAQGSNACQANKELKKVLCKLGFLQLTQAQIEAIKCSTLPE